MGKFSTEIMQALAFALRWIIRTYSNYIDGYLEGEYEEIEGWQDLEVDAYIGDRPVEVDVGYIEDNLVR